MLIGFVAGKTKSEAANRSRLQMVTLQAPLGTHSEKICRRQYLKILFRYEKSSYAQQNSSDNCFTVNVTTYVLMFSCYVEIHQMLA